MREKKSIILAIILLVIAGLAFWWERSLAPAPREEISSSQEEIDSSPENKINNFRECVQAGNPVMESYPRQCRSQEGQTFTEEACVYPEEGGILTLNDAQELAKQSECGDRLTGDYFCNENTGTWWLNLNIEKEGCAPACVVNVATREAEINWRCTGLIIPE